MDHRVIGLGLLLPLLALGASRAEAQRSPDELARAHFQSGTAYFEQGDYEDAAREFMQSYRLSRRGELLENVARAYERALLFDDAIAALRQLGETHPDVVAPEVIETRIANLERLRSRMQGGGGEDPATGTETGTRTETGADPRPEQHAVRGPDTETQPSGGGGGGGGGVSVPGIILLAAGGALGIASIITGAVSHASYEALLPRCRTLEGSTVCPESQQAAIDAGNGLAVTSTILTFTSIAALAVGVVLLVLDQGGGSGEQADLELVPGPGEAGLAARVRF